MSNSTLLELVLTSIEAGEAILDVYESDFSVELKEDQSPLTLADKKSHDIIVAKLLEIDPKVPILSEEGRRIPYSERKEWGTFWCVDPLDGTKEFVKRNGDFTVNIALIENQRSVLGVIYAPVLKKGYFATQNGGAYLFHKSDVVALKITDELIKCSKQLPLEECFSSVTVVGSRSHLSVETAAFIEDLNLKYDDIAITSVGSSLKLCLVAENSAQVYPRLAPTMEWDIAAGHIIAEESGASVLQYENGKPLEYNKENLLNPWFVVSRL